MELKELLIKNRSYRRFKQEKLIKHDIFFKFIEYARLCASARNLQPLKYKIISDQSICSEIFPLLGWAGYLEEWDGPVEGERPSGYIVIFSDNSITISDTKYDQGIVAQTILLTAVEEGLGGCIIGTFDKDKIKEVCRTPDSLIPVLVIALGYPGENVVLTEPENGNIKYFRDRLGNHYVPKRTVEELLIK